MSSSVKVEVRKCGGAESDDVGIIVDVCEDRQHAARAFFRALDAVNVQLDAIVGDVAKDMRECIDERLQADIAAAIERGELVRAADRDSLAGFALDDEVLTKDLNRGTVVALKVCWTCNERIEEIGVQLHAAPTPLYWVLPHEVSHAARMDLDNAPETADSTAPPTFKVGDKARLVKHRHVGCRVLSVAGLEDYGVVRVERLHPERVRHDLDKKPELVIAPAFLELIPEEDTESDTPDNAPPPE